MAAGEDEDDVTDGRMVAAILTPDQRVRVFVSSTMEELAAERTAVREAVDRMHLSPVLFELGARAHPPRSLYRSYLEQSHVFVGIYWERYGWIAPTMDVSGLEDEYLLAGAKPKLMYVKRPAPGREPRLDDLLDRIRSDDDVAYKSFDDAEELEALVADDLSMLLSEAFLVDPGDVPAAPARPRFTLPGDATTFVGREAELDLLRPLIERDDVRLVTLTGPGGIGKTRLALRVAAQAAPAFDEGAAFVSLASITDDRLVVGAIARAVGLRDSSGATVDTLAADLMSRSVLLVVDNFEHVMGAADVVAELLRRAPRLKVVATSREALRVQAEHEFPVPPLTDADSVHMFAERAASVRPDLRLDESAGGTVARICQRLEGVPLAIELAAARVKLLPPDALLERLDRRLDFLVGGPRDLPERQRALRSTIEWSYDLLDEADRRVFSSLGVFVGSFPLAAVEALLADEGDALDLLASLVDKSLLRVEPTSGEPRFRMLAMIAEFARDQLAERDDADRIGERHAAFYREVADAVGAGVQSVGGNQRHWLSVLGDDHDGEAGNVRAALAWFLEHGRLDDLADMAWALWVPAWINGRIDEGRHMARAALDATGEMSERSRARLLAVLGLFAMWAGDHDASAAALADGLQLAEALGDDEVLAAVTLAESMIAGPAQGEARAEELADEALVRFGRLDDAWGEVAALNVLGWLYVAQERFDDHAELLERTLSQAVAVGDEQFAALAEVNLAELALHEGDIGRAMALITSCADRHRALRLPYSVPYLLDGAARLAAHVDEPERAARLVAAATQLRTSAGVSVWGSQLERRSRFVDGLRSSLGTRGSRRPRRPDRCCATQMRSPRWRRREVGRMDEPYRAGGDVHVLPTQLVVPGVGSIPIHAFVLLAEQPVLVDTGLGVDGSAFVEALTSVIDPSELAWVWLTHDDLDHSGNLQVVMDLAPQARLVTNGLGALRMNSSWPVPLERVHAIAPGDRLDVGDRTLVALRPPTYDNPMSTGFFDESTSTLFAVDSFGAILGGPQPDLDALSEEELVGGMVAWATFDSPWLHLSDRDRVAGILDGVRKLAPEQILSSHLPPAVGRMDELLDVVASIPDAEPFVPPDAAAFDEIVAGLRATS